MPDRQQTFPSIWKDYKMPIILGSLSLIVIVLSLLLLIKSTQIAEPIRFSSESSSAGNLARPITVDVEGAVVSPGLYQLPEGSRVEEALSLAGGLTDKADEIRAAKTVNRASIMTDGMKLYIPYKEEAASPDGSGSDKSENSSISESSISLNTASQANLESLPGIGPVTAKKIIDNRPYQTLEEVVSKKAMSQSLFLKLKDQLSL